MKKTANTLSFYGITILLNMSAVSVLLIIISSSNIAGKIGALNVPILYSKQRKTPLVKSGIPVEVVIPSLDMRLPVNRGEYNDGNNSWTLNQSDAFFATPSMPANNSKGNTLIYGHNTKQVFGKLTAISLGSELIVKTDSKLEFKYVYSGEKHVNPSDTSIFSYETAPTVTLQTCTGNWDQLRGLYTFSFKEVVKV